MGERPGTPRQLGSEADGGKRSDAAEADGDDAGVQEEDAGETGPSRTDSGAAGGGKRERWLGRQPGPHRASGPLHGSGATTWSSNGHGYFPIPEMLSWNVARDTCAERSARLVSVAAADENAFVSDLIQVPHWLGFARFGKPTFDWISGDTVTYTNWADDEPSQSGDSGVLLRETGKWFNAAVQEAIRACASGSSPAARALAVVNTPSLADSPAACR